MDERIADAIARRDAGMALAVEHADQVEPAWSDRAFAILGEYVADTSADFTIEDVRVVAEAMGLPRPPDCRAWGAIARRGHRAGLIVPTERFISSNDPKSHRGPNRVWRRA
ncbi:MAG: hypothetical protein H0W40_19310 [Methylibium sp.]|nr:hypothetical protein [Methylibium sp.]